MNHPGFSTAPDDAVLDALFLPFRQGVLRWPDASVLFMNARWGRAMQPWAHRQLVCQQSFKPLAMVLERARFPVQASVTDARYALILVWPARQRDERRAQLAMALEHLAPGGMVLSAVPNAEGARSAQGDFEQLLGIASAFSKHKCRVFWCRPEHARIDRRLCQSWAMLDAICENAGGYFSRPGLFAWDRVDPASQLLAEHLPGDLSGRVADLGAGYGFLSVQVLARCPRVSAIDLFEAEARALAPARANLQRACAGREVACAVHWQDVTGGLPAHYDAIVSNPPFHQGRADRPELGRAFIETAAGALRTGGRCWLVANRHLPYEATLSAHFRAHRTALEDKGYKVIEAVK